MRWPNFDKKNRRLPDLARPKPLRCVTGSSMRIILVKTFLISFALAGCRGRSVEWETSTAGSIEVTEDGRKFYGLYLTAESDEQVVAASGILLIPWDDRPDCSITHENGDTVVEIADRKMRYVGRPLLMLDSIDADLKIIAADIPLSRYDSEARLTVVIEDLLSGALSPNDRK